VRDHRLRVGRLRLRQVLIGEPKLQDLSRLAEPAPVHIKHAFSLRPIAAISCPEYTSDPLTPGK
jgi:hypothetical protein